MALFFQKLESSSKTKMKSVKGFFLVETYNSGFLSNFELFPHALGYYVLKVSVVI
jgi:hypothetical protein